MMKEEVAQELGSLNGNGTKAGARTQASQVSQDRDRDELLRLGKKQVLRRNFAFMSILGFSCTVLITWEGALILFVTGLENGGYAGLIYGYLVVWLGNFAVFASLSELVSMAPTSGGQYHWVAMLAPPRWSKFLSYMTGWVTVLGWQASIASTCSLTSGLIQGLIALTQPDYTPQNWHGTLLLWAVVLFCVFINTVISRLLPKIEGLILILHILGFFAVLIPLVKLSEKADPEVIFTVFKNDGGWSSNGLSFLVGLTGNAFAFLGLDGAYHMSEEIQRPSVIVPRSIMLTLVINGSLGFGMIIAVLFCTQDIDAALDSPTGFPFMEIFRQATSPSVGGAAAMASIITALAMCANVGFLASASRMVWSFARDRGLPGWRILSRVEKRTMVPLWSIATITIIAILLSLITIGSLTAFDIVVSLTVAALYISYMLAIALLLYRRVTGGISYSSDSPTTLANTAGSRLVWGPWRFGKFGPIINVFALCYLLVILVFSFFPARTPVTDPNDMNYSSVLIVAVMAFSLVYYFLYARKTYQGPLVEEEAVSLSGY
ncbi:GABA permease [Coccidioides immitis RS]|uniref:GABA permease n=4 Tax=Coccidioides immitis TaxID=5501 RepID=J3KCZ4_COCIM|nr:GABA permease [Coccidioides immitis RS]EAS33164.3 GABA permease [Coccidioides immitis RS]KMP08457.1 choline transporter [Coccidioides immitis RMSCC 2394]KMU72288.1 hypothetical protein CISG_02937 [Coccidioides immitis RMSCC 3703]TPX20069.1 hypothetical protein DIZ76_017866 [Coccidioides immitis]